MYNIEDAMRMMTRAVEKSKEMIQQEGTLFPMLILYKKGKSLVVPQSEKVKGIICIQNTEDVDNPSQDFITFDGEQVFTSHIIFKYGDGIDESHINRVAKKLTNKYNPDMVGLIMSCLYTTSEKGNLPIHLDPDSDRVLHAVHYEKGTNAGRVINCPYVFRGEFSDEDKIEELDKEINFDAVFMNSSWTSSEHCAIKPLLKNPF